MSAEQGCQLGQHWMGVFYHLAFGVSKNLDKAVELLTKAAKAGNGQSCYQLAILYSNEEPPYFDVKKAYSYFEKALMRGVSLFDDFHELFKKHYDVLAPVFIENKKPTQLVNKDSKEEVTKLHEAYVNEMKTSFS